MATTVKLNPAGVKALLGSPGVRADLTARAERVARAAGPDVTIEQHTSSGYRAVVRVVDDEPDSHGREARDGSLARALAAAG